MSTPGTSTAAATFAPPLRVAPPWLAEHTATLRRALHAGRFPHALLIHEAPGAGGEWLAAWSAQLVLCQRAAQAPCGECTGCRRVAALQHPDLDWLRPEGESRQIRIEQVRDLSADLALTSHAGGYKVAVMTPADALNRFAANALLKTLEEPPERTLLVLVATQPSRLPPTVASRCQRLRVRAPSREGSLAWLNEACGPADWKAALDVLGEAPMLAAQTDPGEVAAMGAESQRTLEELMRGEGDPAAAAERWARSEWALRLLCFENWLTERVRRAAAAGGFLTKMRDGPYLSEAGTFLNIRELFRLVDEVRELRATLDVPLNRAVAVEALFRRLAPAPRALHGAV
ncbi:MAG: DNA polymerase III subunit delta' [Gammaproteobacteria bacterium]|nr:DNA polymerase III subunit delta' [Gammaproteobacteria bacterium]